jgi:hypothetical protein
MKNSPPGIGRRALRFIIKKEKNKIKRKNKKIKKLKIKK